MEKDVGQAKRGFTPGEKWIIWGVFCLLVSLSTYRLSVFAGLMLVSVGGALIVKRENVALGVLIGVCGLLSLVFCRVLI
jgi:hypothetical protein